VKKRRNNSGPKNLFSNGISSPHYYRLMKRDAGGTIKKFEEEKKDKKGLRKFERILKAKKIFMLLFCCIIGLPRIQKCSDKQFRSSSLSHDYNKDIKINHFHLTRKFLKPHYSNGKNYNYLMFYFKFVLFQIFISGFYFSLA